jgi:signal peptidase II
MNRNSWIACLAALGICIGLDYYTKSLALNLTDPRFYGPITLVLQQNHGAMLGLFSNLPKALRVVSLSTGGAFIFFSYLVLQYLLPIQSLTLRVGLSILMGGIMGNVLDRIFWGYIVDFISININGWHSPVFNIADALQWVGYVLVFSVLIKEGDRIWPKDDVRKGYWINKPFQLKYAAIMIFVSLSFTLITMVFSYTYLWVALTDMVGDNPAVVDRFVKPFLATLGIIAIAFSIMLFAVGKILSHRIAGPVYAFERFMKEIFAGKNAKLKLREHDDFKHLEELAEQIKVDFQSQIASPSDPLVIVTDDEELEESEQKAS